jgi:hypothetical protein
MVINQSQSPDATAAVEFDSITAPLALVAIANDKAVKFPNGDAPPNISGLRLHVIVAMIAILRKSNKRLHSQITMQPNH